MILSRFASYIIPCLLVIIMLLFFCGTKTQFKHQKVSEYHDYDRLPHFLLLLMFLLTIPIVKDGHVLPRIDFIFLRERFRTNLEIFQYQIWTLTKRSQKQLSSNSKFQLFFPGNQFCHFYWIRTQNHLVLKRILNHLAKLAK